MKFLGPSRGAVAPLTVLLAVAASCLSQNPFDILDKGSTPQRVAHSPWWPTKQLPASRRYAGPEACAQCHSSIYESQMRTAMAKTAMHAGKSRIVSPKTEIMLGSYRYNVANDQDGLILKVSDGKQSISRPLTWAFGDGSVGQSYLSQIDGSFYEERFTYFASLQAFDLTPGRINGAPVTMDMAVGRPVSEQEARKCFLCHTTGMTDAPALHPERLIMGVTCEACHGPGLDHANDPSSTTTSGKSSIFNPQGLSPADSVDFCGSCHGTWWDVELMGASGLATVRFPAYRLEKSRCWGNGDNRLTCVACHDPHQALVREASAYDQRCLACHSSAKIEGGKSASAPKTCPISGKDCVTCHMPEYELPEMHSKFTDHEIRIVRNAESFPD